MDEYIEAWRFFVKFNVFPNHGLGAGEQPALFFEVNDIMETVKNYISVRNDEKREQLRALKNG